MASTWCGEQTSVLSVTGNELVFTFSSHGSSPQCHTQHDPAAKVTRERSLGELTGVIELVTISLGLIFLLVPPSLGCHPAWIRPLFCAQGKLPSFCDLEKPLGASPSSACCSLTTSPQPARLTSQRQLPNLPTAQPRRGTGGSVGELGLSKGPGGGIRGTGEGWRGVCSRVPGLWQGAEALPGGSGVSVAAEAAARPSGCPRGARGVGALTCFPAAAASDFCRNCRSRGSEGAAETVPRARAMESRARAHWRRHDSISPAGRAREAAAGGAGGSAAARLRRWGSPGCPCLYKPFS